MHRSVDWAGSSVEQTELHVLVPTELLISIDAVPRFNVYIHADWYTTVHTLI
jgi:hypothetical protein